MGKRNRHSKPKQRIIDNPTMSLTVGESIVVKPGVKDPDYGQDIGGWQGRVTEVESYQDGKVTIMFQGNSLSLKAMPASMIRHDEVNVQVGHQGYVFPLCDLKATNKKSINFGLTDDYAVWFANR